MGAAVPGVARVELHPIGIDEARRILAGTPAPHDRWAPDYPFVDALDELRGFVAHPRGAPFGLYAIRGLDDGLLVGGIGFFGPPSDGVAELGFGLVESARGRGFAREALTAAIRIALSNGATSVVADATIDNHASHATMRAAGMVELRRDAELVYFGTASA